MLPVFQSYDCSCRTCFVLGIIKNYSSQLKLSYSYFLSFIFKLLVRASSGDSLILFINNKDAFIDSFISRDISKVGTKVNLQVKLDFMFVIISYTINQFDSYF